MACGYSFFVSFFHLFRKSWCTSCTIKFFEIVWYYICVGSFNIMIDIFPIKSHFSSGHICTLHSAVVEMNSTNMFQSPEVSNTCYWYWGIVPGPGIGIGIDLGILAVLVLVLGIVLSLLEVLVLVLGIDHGLLTVLILVFKLLKKFNIYQGQTW